jgi:hypothetical protein
LLELMIMSQTEKNDDVIKPLDNHASAVDESVVDAAKEQKQKSPMTTQDNHASGGEASPLDNHASGETA